ncbi:phosphatidylglycerol lysyltransferase [Rhizobium petrolearium]|uniref:bifunctional lysylphosphatidylglycerol flippase/synthetase MprF n=1 Tax=Neorhizobium petrolearium TaxID=515361 RepID=UPI001AE8486E|nr:bifunctional lysylphosphatidylglycerol flippase/synthetase MprF [Neorhizobium petrolearium]MBP1846537.1 phosphatidylglycerol lysyltransferase [Neorhizobium petrolearium]
MTPTDRQLGRFRDIIEAYRSYIVALVVVVVFALTTFAIYNLTTEVSYDDVIEALGNTRWSAIGLAVFFTMLSFAALVGYDMNALAYIGRTLPFMPVAMTAFSAYAVGNTAGFGALSGGAIRFRAYSRLGLSPDDIGRVIAFVTLAFGIGLLAVTALASLVTAPRIGAILGADDGWIRAGAILIIIMLSVLVISGRDGRTISIGSLSIRLPDTRTSSQQFLITALDIAASASVLYVLLPQTNIGWPSFLAIYATAVGLGVLSHVPAGLGVFETVIIAALGNTVSIDQVLGSLVLYRVVYHVLPLLIATLVVIGVEIRQLAHHPVASTLRKLEFRLVPPLLAAFAIIAGAMLIFSSVTPTPDSDLNFLSNYLSLPFVEGAHFLSSILGLILFVAARGIGQRLDGAWWTGMVCTALALVFAFVRAIAPFEAIFLVILLVGLFLSAKQFNRRASLFGQVLSPSWIAAMLIIVATAVTVLLFVYREVEYSHELWWQFEFSEEAPRGLRAVLGLAIFAASISFYSLLRPATRRSPPSTADDLGRAIQIVMAQDNADANLVRMGDKRLMFSESGRAFLMYGIQGRSWIALFDPVGPQEETADLVWRFVEEARSRGGRAVFYQISPGLLSHCADAGLRAFRLGELAIIDLSHFDLKGGRLAGLRQAVNKGMREGLEFSVIDAPEVMASIEELRQVSDAWLAEHNTREKTFSLGAFRDDYVASQSVAVLRKEGRIVAFATLLITDTKQEGTVDLMRFSPEAPKGSMDFLFVKVMEYLRDAGYAHFNLGMAPLSGMSTREVALAWDRIGSVVFEHGERFYNFKGLKAFKSKFHPTWEPRYLAVAGGVSPAIVMMDATLLIGGGLRGVVGK